MTNTEQLEDFEKIIHEAVHKFFGNLTDRFENRDLADILGIMQFEIFHIWMEAQDKIILQHDLDEQKK